MFSISLYDLLFRICISFMPPLSKKFQKVHTDLLGPIIALVVFMCILQYGHSNKVETITVSPIKFSFGYLLAMPIICKVLLNVSKSNIGCYELVSLLGYALYGHILSLTISLIFFDESSNRFFFLCLIVFSGLSTFRLAIVLLNSIPKPALRLLVCSIVCVIQILSLIFVHFAYMHKTYIYDRQSLSH